MIRKKQDNFIEKTKISFLKQLKKNIITSVPTSSASERVIKTFRISYSKTWTEVNSLFILLFTTLFLFSLSSTFAQKTKKTKDTKQSTVKTQVKESLTIGPNTNLDSLRRVRTDSAAGKLAKTIPDSVKKEENIKTTVVYSARDSTVMDTEQQVVYLYGDAKVDYGDISLTADYITLNWKTNEVFAKGSRDTTKQKNIGMPVFKQGAESYNSDSIRYNFKSRKAIIKALVTQQGEGFVQGKSVKKDDEDNLYIRNAIYTTCNLKHPHFNIYATKLKIIGKKQIVSGPFNLVLNDIPLPIGLPFGFFPYQQRKENGTSGVIIGQYGEEPAQGGRGFFLRDFGYYWAVNEHIGVQFRSEIYTKGSWGLGANGQYNKKYRYSGSFGVNFNKNIRGDEINPTYSNDFRIQWSHSPISYGKTQFSAAVNLASNSYNQNNTYNDVQAYTSTGVNSSVSYNVNFGGEYRLGTSMSVSQNNTSKEVSVGLTLNTATPRYQPFKNKKLAIHRFMDDFQIGIDLNSSITMTNQKVTFNNPYDFVVTNVLPRDTIAKQELELRNIGRVSSNVNDFSIESLLANAKANTTFNMSIALPSIKLLKYINISPGISMQGSIFTRQFNYQYFSAKNPDTLVYQKPVLVDRATLKYDDINLRLIRSGVRITEASQLNIVPNYSFSVGMNTRVYGMLPLKIGRLQAIRHTISPSVSASYTPDFTDQYFVRTQIGVNEKDSAIYRNLPLFQAGSTVGNKSGSLSFSLSNQFEAKLRSKSDTATKEFEKIILLDNLSLSTSYNFFATEYALSPISLSASSRVKEFNISWSGTLDPYQYVKRDGFEVGERQNKYLWQVGEGFARLSNMNIAISRSFSPAKNKGTANQSTSQIVESGNPNVPNTDATKNQVNQIKRTINDYIDWKVPWKLNVSYNYSYSSPGLTAKPYTTSALTFNGDISISEKWRTTLSTGYDFKFDAVTFTSVGIVRDLHCWEMQFNWTPIASSYSGRSSSYDFTIRAKSSLLQELKLTRRRSFFSNGGF